MQYIAVGSVDLHPVTACLDGVASGHAVFSDRLLDLLNRHCSRRRGSDTNVIAIGKQAVDLKGVEVVVHARRRQWLLAFQNSVRPNSSAMPKLEEETSTALVHGLGHIAPTGNLILAPNSGRMLKCT